MHKVERLKQSPKPKRVKTWKVCRPHIGNQWPKLKVRQLTKEKERDDKQNTTQENREGANRTH
jgi:hypothetical protein